jgi:predicted TPR repeat methyltransferase
VANSIDSLNLYARIETMLENREAIDTLYETYYRLLMDFSFHSLLDIGCGGGAFLQGVRERFPSARLLGVDLSDEMARRTRERGIDAKALDVCDVAERFDAATAVFDMLNYLPKEALADFFACVEARLDEGGRFLFDVNTLFGFENVAVGAYITQDSTRFLAVDSDFRNGTYEADFTLFTQKENGCYAKETQRITQFYHPVKRLKKATSMKLVQTIDIELYGLGDADKTILVFEKH